MTIPLFRRLLLSLSSWLSGLLIAIMLGFFDTKMDAQLKSVGHTASLGSWPGSRSWELQRVTGQPQFPVPCVRKAHGADLQRER